MLNILHLNAYPLLSNVSWLFVTKSFVIGLISFFFFFLLMRTLEKENIYKFDLKKTIKKIKFIKYSNAVMLVKDGVLQLDKLHLVNVTPQQIYEALRNNKISQLSQVERLFLNTGGDFSIYKREEMPAEIPVQYLSKELFNKQGKA